MKLKPVKYIKIHSFDNWAFTDSTILFNENVISIKISSWLSWERLKTIID